MNSNDTIVAAATPLGFSGVAVVRVSGSLAFEIAKKVTHKKKIRDRKATLVDIFNKENEKIDQAIITLFTSPSSYTGEDVVEVSAHGNPTIVEAIISSICSFGGRLAEPGEFTYRSFINGKIDLIQAEAVASLIKSKSIEGAKEQQKILGGRLSKSINKIRGSLINLVSSVEHQLDISEEDVSPDFEETAEETLDSLYEETLEISKTFTMGKMLSAGVSVVITGPPNVGKSSLLNYLCEEEKAIVSSTPGTTRDVVIGELILDGVPFRFYDTAGIRSARGAIEKEGVSRAIAQKKEADLIISVFDKPSTKLEKQTKKPCLFVLNKSDLHVQIPSKPIIHISCKNKTGRPKLLSKIKKTLQLNSISTNVALLSTPRQAAALKVCVENMARAKDLFAASTIELELLSLELRGAIEALDALLGKTTPEDIINNIFKTLCVGK